jgi:hypothetical protein
MYTDYNPDLIYICSVDVGAKHLGLCLIECKEDYTINDIIWFDCVDITQFVHLDDNSKKQCKLYHSKMVSDYCSHIFHLYYEMFEICKHIIIERQPLNGYTHIEQLFVYNFRDKIILISPNSLHAFYGWRKDDLDYEQRKVKSIEVALQLIEKSPRDYLIQEFNNLRRKHDVSDAICMTHFYTVKTHKIYIENKRKQKISDRINKCGNNYQKSIIWLDMFKL